MSGARPLPQLPPLSIFDWIRELLSFGIALGSAVYCAANFTDLPATIPTHYDFQGHADGFGSRATILAVPAVAVIFTILLTAVQRFPQYHNFPAVVTEDNAQRLYYLSRKLLIALKLALNAIFGYLTVEMVATGQGGRNTLNPLFGPVAVVLTFAIVGYYIYKIRRAR